MKDRIAKEKAMTKLRVHNFSVSLDGYGAGRDQSLENPLGVGGEDLHHWMFKTAWGTEMSGGQGGETGVDNDFAARFGAGIGAWIMGRNMFGPIRGDWPDEAWRGWWGENPPYHHPVFVLTRYPRKSIEMDGGTVFHFVTDGIEAAFARATEASAGQDIQLLGGASTIRQYMRAKLVDELHFAIAPVLLGGGERLLDDDVTEGYEVAQYVPGKEATHVVLRLAR
jgi:dihydrofolate reductase